MIGLQGEDEFRLSAAMDVHCRSGVVNYSSRPGDEYELRLDIFLSGLLSVPSIASLSGLTLTSIALVARRISFAARRHFQRADAQLSQRVAVVSGLASF